MKDKQICDGLDCAWCTELNCPREQNTFIYTDNSTKDNTLEKIHNVNRRNNNDRWRIYDWRSWKVIEW